MTNLIKFHVLIEERQRVASYSPAIRDAASGQPVAAASGPEFEYVPITDAYIDSDQVLAGLLRSLADKLDPPAKHNSY